MTTVEALQSGRELVADPEAWGSCCSAIALHKAEGNFTITTDAQRALLRAIAEDDEGKCAFVRIWKWNDSPERTHAEVLAAFDRAIAAEEANARG